MGKLRINFIKKIGYVSANGDKFVNNVGRSVTIGENGCTERGVNGDNNYGDEICITSFTERENKGVQPVPDGFPVVLNYGKSQSKCNAEMCNHWSGDSVKSWKPDYDKLLEMQKEHDAKQEGIEYCKQFDETDIEELMINAKESKMSKNNKHPHHDLIVEWAKDTSKVVQFQSGMCGWITVKDPSWDVNAEYRIKPREFQKGHWYPCVDSNGDSSVYFYDGNDFRLTFDYEYEGDNPNDMKWIGESLGEIEFGGEE